MTNTKISVIIPTYRRSQFVLQAVQSVLKQSFDSIEVIVVDDYSCDNTSDILKGINDPRVVFVQHDANKGAPAARNTGLSVSSGSYIAFLDDDDYWQPDKLEKQLNVFLSRDGESAGLVYCGFKYKHDGIEKKMTIPHLKGDICMPLLSKNFIGSASIPLVRKECLDSVGGFDESFESCQDWDLWVRVAAKYPVLYSPEYLVVRTVHGEQISANCSRKVQGRKRFIEKHRALLDRWPKQLASHWQRLGTLFSLIGDIGCARTYYWLAVKSNPFNWKTIFGIILTYIPVKLRQKVLQKKAVVNYGDITFFH